MLWHFGFGRLVGEDVRRVVCLAEWRGEHGELGVEEVDSEGDGGFQFKYGSVKRPRDIEWRCSDAVWLVDMKDESSVVECH